MPRSRKRNELMMKTAVQRSGIVPSVNMTMKGLTLVPSLLQGHTPIDSLCRVYLVV